MVSSNTLVFWESAISCDITLMISRFSYESMGDLKPFGWFLGSKVICMSPRMTLVGPSLALYVSCHLAFLFLWFLPPLGLSFLLLQCLLFLLIFLFSCSAHLYNWEHSSSELSALEENPLDAELSDLAPPPTPPTDLPRKLLPSCWLECSNPLLKIVVGQLDNPGWPGAIPWSRVGRAEMSGVPQSGQGRLATLKEYSQLKKLWKLDLKINDLVSCI